MTWHSYTVRFVDVALLRLAPYGETCVMFNVCARKAERDRLSEEAVWKEKLQSAASVGLGTDGGGDAYERLSKQAEWAKQWERDERDAVEQARAYATARWLFM